MAEAFPTFDQERAQELYDEYKNDPERSDGLPVGTDIGFTYNCPPDPSLNELSQLYQNFWSQLGMEVELNTVEQAAHVQNGIAKDYEVQCWRVGSETDPYTTLRDAFTEGPLNFTGYTSDTINEALDDPAQHHGHRGAQGGRRADRPGHRRERAEPVHRLHPHRRRGARRGEEHRRLDVPGRVPG